MKARVTAIILTAAVVVYCVLLGRRAVELIQTGKVAGIALGAGVLVLPIVGLWIAAVNLRFGARVEKLGRRLAETGRLPDSSELPKRPSGRVDREAADEWFQHRRAEVESDPDDWGSWYRLAYGYDLAGDRRRAREAMRHALRLADAS